MKRKLRKTASAIAIILALAMALSACGNGGTTTTPASSAPEASGTTATTNELPVYTIGFNTWGSGVPILDLFGDETEWALGVLGMRGNRVSDDFTAERELQNVQNFISAGVDGIALQGAADPVVPQAGEAAMNAEIPFVLLVFVGADDDRAHMAANNPYYVGAVNSDLYYDGYTLGQAAIRDGNRTAVLIGGNIGDSNMDQRSQGFRQAFVTEGGGTVLDEARCTSPAEALQKASDMLSTHRDTDALYAMVGDYVPGSITAMDNLSIEGINVYSSCVDLVTANYIIEGRVVEGNDGIGLSAVIAPAMLINFLDGHPILDANGNKPEFKTIPFRVNADNAEDYISIFYTQGVNPVTQDILKSMVWRFNPDVSYQTYVDLIESGLSLDALLRAHGR